MPLSDFAAVSAPAATRRCTTARLFTPDLTLLQMELQSVAEPVVIILQGRHMAGQKMQDSMKLKSPPYS